MKSFQELFETYAAMNVNFDFSGRLAFNLGTPVSYSINYVTFSFEKSGSLNLLGSPSRL